MINQNSRNAIHVVPSETEKLKLSFQRNYKLPILLSSKKTLNRQSYTGKRGGGFQWQTYQFDPCIRTLNVRKIQLLLQKTVYLLVQTDISP